MMGQSPARFVIARHCNGHMDAGVLFQTMTASKQCYVNTRIRSTTRSPIQPILAGWLQTIRFGITNDENRIGKCHPTSFFR